MSFSKTEIENLVSKLLDGDISEDELSKLNSWINLKMKSENYVIDQKIDPNEDLIKEKIRTEILKKINYPFKQSNHNILKNILKLVAILTLIISFGYVLFNKKNTDTEYLPLVQEINPDIIDAPRNAAFIKLSDGKIIKLSESQNVIKVGDHNISYGEESTPLIKLESDAQVQQFFTLSTPVGSTYNVILNDGSKVWLNGKSKLIYPNKFVGNNRVVELIGEGYFSIISNKDHPFIVKTQGQITEVLGTEFNIKSLNEYNETTLIEGKVKLKSYDNNDGKTLSPGDQAINYEGKISIKKVNVEEYIAWKNGYFYFDGLDLKIALKQMADWYDFDLIIEKNVVKNNFFGTISRKKSLGFILKILKKSGLEFSFNHENGRNKLRIKN